MPYAQNNQARVAIIGGTGLTALAGLVIQERREIITPYGATSDLLCLGEYHGQSVLFLARHGEQHTIPPHQVNYRANLWALRELGANQVISVAAVGAIHPQLAPSELAIPDQIIDYTWGREHTYSDLGSVQHVDFTEPYDAALRQRLLTAAAQANIKVLNGGTYAACQGPRLETAAEIRRLKQDGCDMVGMTAMPEASLARELALPYAAIAVSVNWAAGLGDGADIHADIAASITLGMSKARAILAKVLNDD